MGIVGGRGKMGIVLADFFRKKGYEVLISDRETEMTNAELTQKSDIILISVPLSVFEKVILEIAPFLKKDALLMDISSVKKMPLAVMMHHFSGAVLATHPMCAPHNFSKGQTIVFCGGRHQERHTEIQNLFSDFEVVKISAEEHDLAMGLIQGVEHLMKIAFAKTIAESGLSLSLLQKTQSPIYRFQMALVGRLLSQNEKLYSEISFGSTETRKAIADFSKNVDFFAHCSRSEFEKNFVAAREFFAENCEIAKKESDQMIAFFTGKK